MYSLTFLLVCRVAVRASAFSMTAVCSLLRVCVLPLEWPFVFFTFYASALGGIKRYRYPSVCLSHGAAALGA